jgi:hypothetical protein
MCLVDLSLRNLLLRLKSLFARIYFLLLFWSTNLLSFDKVPTVTLSDDEWDQASEVVRIIEERTLARGGNNRSHGLKQAFSHEERTIAHAAELAAAIALNVYWTGSEGNSSASDIGQRTQVRCLLKETSRCLLIRESEIRKYGNVPFVLVRYREGKFLILGWIMAEKAKEVGKLTDGGDASRPPMYLVEQKHLHSVFTLHNP